MFRFPPMNHIGFRVTKKILIGISLIISYVLTLSLSLFLTPPYPRLSIIIDSINRLRNNEFKIQLPIISTSFSLEKIFSLSKISGYPNPVDQNSPSGTNTGPIFSKNTPAPGQRNNPTSPPSTKYPTATSNQPTTSSLQNPTSPPTPKPTKPPKPTPTPTITITNPRPGKNFEDTANIVGKIMCIPPAMIMATLHNEYGPWLAGVEANWTARNTYQGSDPHDVAGSTAVPSDNVMQMMEDTWHRIKPIIANKLGTSELSLDVTFDSMAAGSYHLRNISLAMHDGVACNDWPVKYILFGACRYSGGCTATSTTYNQYAYDVCNAYNRYTTGPQKNCQ